MGARECYRVITIACVLAAISCCQAVSATTADRCSVENPFADNKTVSMEYLHDNVTTIINTATNATATIALSFVACAPQAIYEGGQACGEAYLALRNDTCAASILFDVLVDVLVIDNSTSLVVLSSSANAGVTVNVTLTCITALDITNSAPWVKASATTYTVSYVTETVCPGYTPASTSGSGSEEHMLSKGAIVGIIIGIVAVVVFTAALLQWRAKSESDDYQRMA